MTRNMLLQNRLKKYLYDYFKECGIISPKISIDKSEVGHGDISCNASLKYAIDLGVNPIDIATKAVHFLKTKNIPGIADIKAASPGYINFFFSLEYIKEALEDIISKGSRYGSNKRFDGEKWIIEHTSPNPNKAMHLGHLRNNLIGMSLKHLLEFCGAKVICDSVDNDRGIAIAKLMWGFLSHMRKNSKTEATVEAWFSNKNDWYSPEELRMSPDRFVSKCYNLADFDFKSSQNVEDAIRDLVIKWEDDNKAVIELWKFVLNYSYDGINRTLSRIGNQCDKVWHEHEHYKKGKLYILKGLEKGIFKKLKDGAVLTNLEKYNIPNTILLKNDGTSLYITQDIALTALKKRKYPEAKKMIWVVGSEQAIAMKQLFAVCEQLGIGQLSDFTHISYGCVGLKIKGRFKKMSSREGTVVLIDDIIDSAKFNIKNVLEKESFVKNADTLSEKLALAAIKFDILKIERKQNIAFDIEGSIDPKGNTGIYVLYTYARINSILSKAASRRLTIRPEQKKNAEEIVKKMVDFQLMVTKSINSYSVHYITHYLLELSSDFNSWYNREMILDNTDNQPHKLAVTKAVSQVLSNGLALLGIDVVERI